LEPRATGKRTSVREKGAHSRWREPGDRVKAWESVKPGVIRQTGSALRHVGG